MSTRCFDIEDLYAAFLEVLATAPLASDYVAEMRWANEGFELGWIIQPVPGVDFDSLPWDGEVGDIKTASWSMPQDFRVACDEQARTVTLLTETRSRTVRLSFVPDAGRIFLHSPVTGTFSFSLTGINDTGPTDWNFQKVATLVGTVRDLLFDEYEGAKAGQARTATEHA